MKTLLLLRHAKSSWKNPKLDDHDRPLNGRGERDAPRMGKLLFAEQILPDLIVSSSATRCRQTAEYVIAASGYRGETRFTNEVYEADTQKLRGVLAALPESARRVLLIGHNPGLSELLGSLCAVDTTLPTAALAHVELPLESWQQLDEKTRGRLVHLWQPREL